MERVTDQMSSYLDARASAPFWAGPRKSSKMAYFSAEYGLADCLSLYSGGLGMLSGDHLKSASDLNLPLVGVGLAYGQGYFTQYLNADGWQQEEYHPNDFWNLPMEPGQDEEGKELRIRWTSRASPCRPGCGGCQVGRVPLYLMDANLDDNPQDLRAITYQLYGGDRQMRIRQEILLGIGGRAPAGRPGHRAQRISHERGPQRLRRFGAHPPAPAGAGAQL